jgi:hypothetical protein
MAPVEDPENCILGICCNPTRRRAALAMRLAAEVPHLNTNQAAAVADWINNNYDLAPKGLLDPLKENIAANAREYPYQG